MLGCAGVSCPSTQPGGGVPAGGGPSLSCVFSWDQQPPEGVRVQKQCFTHQKKITKMGGPGATPVQVTGKERCHLSVKSNADGKEGASALLHE